MSSIRSSKTTVMDAAPSSSCASRVPYLALKHATGSEHPVFFSVSEAKAIVSDATGGELENNNCWATPQGWVLVRDAAASSTYLVDPRDRSTRIQLQHLLKDDLPFRLHLPALRSTTLILLIQGEEIALSHRRQRRRVGETRV